MLKYNDVRRAGLTEKIVTVAEDDAAENRFEKVKTICSRMETYCDSLSSFSPESSIKLVNRVVVLLEKGYLTDQLPKNMVRDVISFLRGRGVLYLIDGERACDLLGKTTSYKANSTILVLTSDFFEEALLPGNRGGAKSRDRSLEIDLKNYSDASLKIYLDILLKGCLGLGDLKEFKVVVEQPEDILPQLVEVLHLLKMTGLAVYQKKVYEAINFILYKGYQLSKRFAKYIEGIEKIHDSDTLETNEIRYKLLLQFLKSEYIEYLDYDGLGFAVPAEFLMSLEENSETIISKRIVENLLGIVLVKSSYQYLEAISDALSGEIKQKIQIVY